MGLILDDLPLIQASFQIIFRDSSQEQLEFVVAHNVSFRCLHKYLLQMFEYWVCDADFSQMSAH
jgi:hypothetical protein